CPIAATLRNALASLKRRVFSSRKITGFRPTLKYAVLRMDTKKQHKQSDRHAEPECFSSHNNLVL
ncbi:hypothetical protein, partial [Fulvivirga sp. M361]|uniref:hypothetical protein n=1 Tax=Fulvivirga sp. M361 TaxID=2594266 RepID=UPI001C886BCB